MQTEFGIVTQFYRPLHCGCCPRAGTSVLMEKITLWAQKDSAGSASSYNLQLSGQDCRSAASASAKAERTRGWADESQERRGLPVTWGCTGLGLSRSCFPRQSHFESTDHTRIISILGGWLEGESGSSILAAALGKMAASWRKYVMKSAASEGRNAEKHGFVMQ